MRAALVHLVQVRGGVLLGLAAGEEDDPRHSGGDVPVEASERPSATSSTDARSCAL